VTNREKSGEEAIGGSGPGDIGNNAAARIEPGRLTQDAEGEVKEEAEEVDETEPEAQQEGSWGEGSASRKASLDMDEGEESGEEANRRSRACAHSMGLDGDGTVGSPGPNITIWPDTDSECGRVGATQPLAVAPTIWLPPAAVGSGSSTTRCPGASGTNNSKAEQGGNLQQDWASEASFVHNGCSESVDSASSRFRALEAAAMAAPACAVDEDPAADAVVYAVEEVLERAGHMELADRMFLWLASVPAKRVLAALFHFHYGGDLRPRRSSDEARFVRRLALLLGEPTPSLSHAGSGSGSCTGSRRRAPRDIEALSCCSLSSTDFGQAAMLAAHRLASRCP